MKVEWPSKALKNKVKEVTGPAPGTSIQVITCHYYYYAFHNKEQKHQRYFLNKRARKKGKELVASKELSENGGVVWLLISTSQKEETIF